MNLFPDRNQTISGLIPQLRSQQLSCEDLLSRCLQRIDEREAEVRAWVLVDREGAMACARELDAEFAAGRDRGPLHGIPIGIKDIVDVAGWPTAAGSQQWKNRVAEHDAKLVTRLRDAGAVLLGKTVTTQYASFDPPVTHNPWNLDRTPGGSSSGSAAAVATGMCLAAIGSQTGGSITRPASYCGVCGCKPSYGRVSLRGVLPLAPSMDHPGPLARSVEDLELVDHAIAGYDLNDPHTFSRAKHADEAANGDANDPEAPRLGQLAGMFSEMASDEVSHAFLQATETLRSAGATIVATTLPPQFDPLLALHGVIMATEAAAVHEQRVGEHPEEYDPCITKLINEGLSTRATDYARAREHQLLTKRTIMQTLHGFDALICPATTDAAPDASTTGNPAFNSPWSYTGLPVVSFPIGLSPDGLPLSVQLVGRPRGEASLFRAARWCADRFAI